MAGLKFDFGLLGVEAHGPLAAGALQGEDALRVGADLRGVLGAIDIGEGQGLIAEIDHVLHVALRDHAGKARVAGGLPGIPGDLVGADQGSVAVGLIGRELFAPGVVELQVFGDSIVPGGAFDAADVLFVEGGEHAHAAEDIGGGGDDARPHGALFFEAVERAGIVVEALFEELQLLALHEGVAVGDGVELGALGEVAGVTGDAEGGFLVNAGDAVEGAAAARGVGEPGIAGAHDVVHGGADGVAGIVVGRRIVDAGAEFEFGMVGAHADVIGAGLLEDAGGELVAGERLHFVGLGDGVLAFGVLFGLAGVDAEEADVGGDVVAVHQFDLKEDELGTGGIEFEAVPVFAGGGVGGVLAGGAGKREVLDFIAGGGDELAERDGRGVLPGVVGCGGEGPAIDLQMVAAFRPRPLPRRRAVGRRGRGGRKRRDRRRRRGGFWRAGRVRLRPRRRRRARRGRVARGIEAEEQAVAGGWARVCRAWWFGCGFLRSRSIRRAGSRVGPAQRRPAGGGEANGSYPAWRNVASSYDIRRGGGNRASTR